MKLIIILDPQNTISQNRQTSIRHQKYSRMLYRKSNREFKLIIIDNKFLNSTYLPFTKIRALNYIIYLKRLISFFKKENRSIELVICGEPWLTYWIAKLSSKLGKKKFPIQIQFHGDFGSRNWRTASIKNWLKYCFLFIKNRQVVSLRFVSELQYQNLKHKVADWQRLCVIPVPLAFENIPIRKRKSNLGVNFKLLMVGRVELDRGLNVLTKLLRRLDNYGLGFKLIIAGQGSKINWLKQWTSSNTPNLQLEIEGFIDGKKIYKIFSKADLTLNLATSESYGRAARESLVAGTPVLATKSSGMVTLHSQVKGNGITFLPSKVDEISNIHKIISNSAKKVVSHKTKFKLVDESESNYEAIVDDWIRTVREIHVH